MGKEDYVTKMILARAERDKAFRDDLIEKLEDRAREYKEKLVQIERALKSVKKFVK